MPCEALERGPSRRMDRGFALVVTLALMVLLVVVAVGLLQLSVVSLRTSNHTLMLAAARANARVSLMLAINQLQMELGPDRRISAPAGILDGAPDTPTFDGVAQPHFTGVWNAAESPFTPRWTLDSPSYDKKTSFRTWLVSGNPTGISTLDYARNGAPGQTWVAVKATSGANSEVRIPGFTGARASFAWWTSDDGIKAQLRPGEEPDPLSRSKVLVASRRANGDGHAVLDSRLPDRVSGLDDRLLDMATVGLAVPPADPTKTSVSDALFHDMTTHSETLPVDVTTGGFRKCMNLYLDWLGSQDPATRSTAGTVGTMKPENPLMDYRLFSWDQLRNYESLSRAGSMVTLDPSSKRPTIRTHKQTGAVTEPEWNPNVGIDRFRIQPVLLKLCYVMSYSTERLTAPADPAKPYALRFYLYPMAVLWNPYNIDLEVPEYCVIGACPLSFDINKGKPDAIKVDLTQNQSATMLAFGPEMGGPDETLKGAPLKIPAGATKVLYPQPVRWKDYPTEHRYTARNFPWHYYMWAQAKKFDLGDSNFGGILKNLRGNQSVANFASEPANEYAGAESDTLSIGITPTTVGNFGAMAAHTDWWGNNGPGSDSAETLIKFGFSSSVAFRVESNSPQISIIPEGELPTRTFGELENRPTPLLLYEIYRKAADEDLFPGKYGSFSVAGNPVHARTDSTLGADLIMPWFESPYSFRFKSITSWMDVTKTFQMPPERDDQIYFGASYSPRGQLSVVDQEIPLSPLTSLAELQHLPLYDYRPTYDPTLSTYTMPPWYSGDLWFNEGHVTQFPQNHAIGNSYASPGIMPEKLVQPGWRCQFNAVANHLRTDRSYIANSVLWDSWFCSSIAARDGLLLTQDDTMRTARKVAEECFAGTTPLPNDAMQPSFAGDPAKVVASLFEDNGNPVRDAHEKIAEYLRIKGGFNINSVSAEAWAHFLSGLLSRPLLMMESTSGNEPVTVMNPEKGKFLISRHSLVNAPPAERGTGKQTEDRYWNGSREITASQVRQLAAAIVRQVKRRGPFLSLGEFVNRRLERNSKLALSGALQSALDDPQVSINEPLRGSTVTGAETVSNGRARFTYPDAAKGPRLQGITGYVTQADLLSSLGPRISPRSDTFTVRAMGEAKNSNGDVQARVWCEAVIQRSSSYVDPSDAATTAMASLNSINTRFGRRFNLVSFRWLQPQELQPAS